MHINFPTQLTEDEDNLLKKYERVKQKVFLFIQLLKNSKSLFLIFIIIWKQEKTIPRSKSNKRAKECRNNCSKEK